MNAIDPSVFDVFREAGGTDTADTFVTELIDEYLAEATSGMAILKDAVERGDGAAIRRATHSLKGMSSTVGAGPMAAMCEELEILAHGTTFAGTAGLFAALENEFTRVRVALLVEQGTVR